MTCVPLTPSMAYSLRSTSWLPDGTLIGRLNIPEPVSDIAFGGPKNNRLFITASTSLYSLVTAVTGLPRVRC